MPSIRPLASIPALLFLLSACGGSPPDTLGSLDEGLAPCPGSSNCVHTGLGVPEGTAPFLLAPEWTERTVSELADAVTDEVAALPRTQVVRRSTPAVGTGGLYLRAESTSRIFRFVDDLEVHHTAGTEELVVRSASRVGDSDMGVNQERVEQLRTRLLEAGVLRDASASPTSGAMVPAGGNLSSSGDRTALGPSSCRGVPSASGHGTRGCPGSR